MAYVKDATTDPQTIRHWYQRWASANVTVTLGTKSGLVVDTDSEEAQQPLHELPAPHGHLPQP